RRLAGRRRRGEPPSGRGRSDVPPIRPATSLERAKGPGLEAPRLDPDYSMERCRDFGRSSLAPSGRWALRFQAPWRPGHGFVADVGATTGLPPEAAAFLRATTSPAGTLFPRPAVDYRS